jgi:glycosyltransferase involved in cell wall biosynthesis
MLSRVLPVSRVGHIMTSVAVVIPAYNAALTLDRTLASVRAQSHSDLEIIVVDDGSTDDTAARAARHAEDDGRIRLVTQENAGVAAARNRGIALARSDWVAPLDADDLWHPRTVASFLAAAASAPERVAFVYTWSRRIDAQDRLVFDLGRPNYRGHVLRQLLVSNFIRNASATMLDRAAVLGVGGYDSGLQQAGAHGAEDIDLYLRLAEVGSVEVAPGYHVGYRQMPGSMSQSADRMRASVELAIGRLEATEHELPPRLFAVARANYDIYAAGVSFAARRWGDLGRYAGRAIRRATLPAMANLSIIGTYGVFTRLRRQELPAFADLDPDRCYTSPVADLYMHVQDRLLASTRAAPPARWS